MVYFPEPVFRNIASFLIDPYKEDQEKHAKVWQKIRVLRYLETIGHGVSDDEDGEFEEYEYNYYYAVLVEGEWVCQLPTTLTHHDDVSGDYDNMFEWDESDCHKDFYNWAGQCDF